MCSWPVVPALLQPLWVKGVTSLAESRVTQAQPPRTPWPPWHLGQADCLVTLTHLQAWFLSDEMSRASVSCWPCSTGQAGAPGGPCLMFDLLPSFSC